MGVMLHVNNWLHNWCQQQGFGLQGTQSEINVCLGEIGNKSLSWAKIFLLTRWLTLYTRNNVGRRELPAAL